MLSKDAIIGQMNASRYALDLLQILAMDTTTHPAAKDFLWNAAFYVAGVGSMPRPPVPGYEQEAGDNHPLPIN